jgi:exopolyphosphatase/guanosine-5'-triphosphate,3'-diphosphate pyrophosphatase
VRVATIDIGTNTTLMLVAERRGDAIAKVEDHAEITRLGKGVDRTKRLDDAAIARTLAVLERYAARAKELGVARIAAVATSASRDASNGPEFRARAAATLGVAIDDVQIVDGAREAKLTFVGALGGLGIDAGARVAVIDVGGGSTEIVVGACTGGIDWSHSYDVGSVRLTERRVKNDPPTRGELEAVEGDAQRAFETPKPPSERFSAVVAIAGTATTYAAIDRKLVRYADDPPHGHRLSLATLRTLVDALAAEPLDARRRTTGLEPGRADVIVAGGLILEAATRALGADTLVISDHGVRWGLAEELLAPRR